MPADTEVPPIVADDRHHDPLPRRARPRRRRLPPSPRRGPLAHGRERRRQVHPHQGAHRRVRDRQRDRSSSPARRACSRTPPMPRAPGSPPCTRRSTCARTSRSARTSCSGTSRARPAASTGRPRTARPPGTSTTSACTSTRARRSSSHSIAIQQLVAISRAMVLDAKVLILDEPTSSLDRGEVEQLFGVIRDLRDRGRRDPLRQPLPRPDLRDLRPHHGPAQRPARRRVRRRRPPPRRRSSPR